MLPLGTQCMWNGNCYTASVNSYVKMATNLFSQTHKTPLENTAENTVCVDSGLTFNKISGWTFVFHHLTCILQYHIHNVFTFLFFFSGAHKHLELIVNHAAMSQRNDWRLVLSEEHPCVAGCCHACVRHHAHTKLRDCGTIRPAFQVHCPGLMEELVAYCFCLLFSSIGKKLSCEMENRMIRCGNQMLKHYIFVHIKTAAGHCSSSPAGFWWQANLLQESGHWKDASKANITKCTKFTQN